MASPSLSLVTECHISQYWQLSTSDRLSAQVSNVQPNNSHNYLLKNMTNCFNTKAFYAAQ